MSLCASLIREGFEGFRFFRGTSTAACSGPRTHPLSSDTLSRLFELRAIFSSISPLRAFPRSSSPVDRPRARCWTPSASFLRIFRRDTLSWRFDPVVIDPNTGFDEYEDTFRRLAGRLQGLVHACVTSYVHPYAKVKARFSSDGREIRVPGLEARRGFSRRMSFLAARTGMTLRPCCNEDLVLAGIRRAHCIDGEALAELFGPEPGNGRRATPTRRGRGCSESIDIGSYNTCPSACLYCYACGAGPPIPVIDRQSGMGFDEGEEVLSD